MYFFFFFFFSICRNFFFFQIVVFFFFFFKLSKKICERFFYFCLAPRRSLFFLSYFFFSSFFNCRFFFFNCSKKFGKVCLLSIRAEQNSFQSFILTNFFQVWKRWINPWDSGSIAKNRCQWSTSSSQRESSDFMQRSFNLRSIFGFCWWS